VVNEVRCVKIKLKPGSLARVRAWAAEINTRRAEALATLEDESIVLESFFLDRTDAGDYLIGYIRAGSLAQAAEAVKRSTHELDAYHAQFKKDTWESGRQLELLVDLERLKA
jgi:hypothetical protein